MTAGQSGRIDAVEGARKLRKLLRGCMEDLEASIAAPASGRVKRWAQKVSSSLDIPASAFEHHVTETESHDGFLQQLITEAPRLHPAALRLRTDHSEIKHLIEDLRMSASEAARGEESSPEELRRASLELLGRLARHRQRGADLIYDAYLVDIGVGD